MLDESRFCADLCIFDSLFAYLRVGSYCLLPLIINQRLDVFLAGMVSS